MQKYELQKFDSIRFMLHELDLQGGYALNHETKEYFKLIGLDFTNVKLEKTHTAISNTCLLLAQKGEYKEQLHQYVNQFHSVTDYELNDIFEKVNKAIETTTPKENETIMRGISVFGGWFYGYFTEEQENLHTLTYKIVEAKNA